MIVYFVPLNELESKFQVPINAFLNVNINVSLIHFDFGDKRNYFGRVKKKIKTSLILQSQLTTCVLVIFTRRCCILTLGRIQGEEGWGGGERLPTINIKHRSFSVAVHLSFACI